MADFIHRFAGPRALFMVLMLALALAARGATAAPPKVHYFGSNPAIQVLDVTAVSDHEGTRFYVYVSNTSAGPITLYLRGTGLRLKRARGAGGALWSLFDIASRSAGWVQFTSAAAASGCTLQVSFVDPTDGPA